MSFARLRTALGSASDWGPVAALLVLGAIDLLAIDDGFRGGRAANAAFIAASVLPLLWRRRAPVRSFFAVWLAMGTGMLALYGFENQGPIERGWRA
jgi:hypothetical protein